MRRILTARYAATAYKYLIGCTLALLTLSGCSQPSTLQEIRNEGVLHVITRVAPSIYYEGRNGPTGYDYELTKLFAEELGVELRLRVAEDNTEVLSVLSKDFAHIGLAGLSAQPLFENQYKTLPTGIKAQSIVVYNRDVERPEALGDLAGQILHLVSDSNHEYQLQVLTDAAPDIHWQVHPGLDAAGVLARVETGELSYAIVSSNELELNHVFFPQVKQGFALGEAKELAWLFPANQDDSLITAAKAFIEKMQADGTIAQLSERFYGHLDHLNYVGARTFMHHVENRLPNYETLFRVHEKIPERIAEPDRTWFALASYNVGYGHLEDARKLTEGAGKNPDRWMDVKEFLPLLAQKEWYKKTRFGYARGHEPVLYVQNIRRYYDVLARMMKPTEDTPTTDSSFVGLEQGSAGGGLPEEGADMRAGLPPELGMIPPTL